MASEVKCFDFPSLLRILPWKLSRLRVLYVYKTNFPFRLNVFHVPTKEAYIALNPLPLFAYTYKHRKTMLISNHHHNEWVMRRQADFDVLHFLVARTKLIYSRCPFSHSQI